MNEAFAIDVKLIVEMSIVKPFRELSALETPTLIVHGRADSMVPYGITEARVGNVPNIKLIGVDDMDHGFTHVDDDVGDSSQSEANLQLIGREILNNIRNSK